MFDKYLGTIDSQQKIEFPSALVIFFHKIAVAWRSHPFTVRKAKTPPMLRPLETKEAIPASNDVFIILSLPDHIYTQTIKRGKQKRKEQS